MVQSVGDFRLKIHVFEHNGSLKPVLLTYNSTIGYFSNASKSVTNYFTVDPNIMFEMNLALSKTFPTGLSSEDLMAMMGT